MVNERVLLPQVSVVHAPLVVQQGAIESVSVKAWGEKIIWWAARVKASATK